MLITMKICLMMKKRNSNADYHLNISKQFVSAIAIFVIFLLASNVFASGKLPLPRFVMTKSNEVNARTGPGVRYPTDWIFIKKGEPLEVVAEFDQWRYVRDIKGDVGWIHSSVLSGKRAVVITGEKIQNLQRSADIDSRVVAKLTPGLRCQLNKCKDGWCKLKCEGYVGWIKREYLWGIRQGEVL
jgi:SH3-like domain-containing protein